MGPPDDFISSVDHDDIQRGLVPSTSGDDDDEQILQLPKEGNVSVIDFINLRFPSEAALEADLDTFLAAIRRTLIRLDRELEDIVRAERHGGAKSAREVAEAARRLDEFRQAMGKVQSAALAAERAVDNAAREIRPFDRARRNIAATSSALTSLVELDDAVRTCERAVETKNLVDIGDGAQLLRIAEILPQFQALIEKGDRGLRKLPVLVSRAVAVREQLCKLTLMEFKAILSTAEQATKPTERLGEMTALRLRAVCVIADQLDESVRADITGHFLATRQGAYQSFFDRHTADLEQSDKRFAWIRTELHTLNAQGWDGIFPASWHILERVCEVICVSLGTTLSHQLAKRSGGKPDVDLLLLVMQRSIDFERELDIRFGKANPTTENTSSGIVEAPRSELASFVGLVSSHFEPYMGSYVDNEDKSLAELVERLVREETWNIGEDASVLGSSVELFLQIKKSVRRCAALTRMKALFDLHKILKKHLRTYSGALGKQLERGLKEATGRTPSKTPDDDLAALDTFRKFTFIVGTAEYCATTVDQLEEALKTQIDPTFASQVSLSEEHDELTAVTARGVRIAVRYCESRIEPAMGDLIQTNWALLTSVEDHSPYVTKMTTELNKLIPEASRLFSATHYRFFCERLASSIIPRYHTALFRCRNVTELGAQQLLLDIAAIKSVLLNMPRASTKVSGSATTSSVTASMKTYVNFVEREIQKVEVVLKIILAPSSHVVEMYAAMVPDGAPAEFQRILELKGFTREKSTQYVLEYAKVSGIGESQGSLSTFSHTKNALPHASRSTSGTGVPERGHDAQQEDSAIDSVRRMLGRISATDLSSQLEQTAGRLKGRFST